MTIRISEDLLHWVSNFKKIVNHAHWIGIKLLIPQQAFWPRISIFKKNPLMNYVRQRVPKSYFQCQFWMSKTNQFFSKKDYLRISIF